MISCLDLTTLSLHIAHEYNYIVYASSAIFQFQILFDSNYIYYETSFIHSFMQTEYAELYKLYGKEIFSTLHQTAGKSYYK